MYLVVQARHKIHRCFFKKKFRAVEMLLLLICHFKRKEMVMVVAVVVGRAVGNDVFALVE